MKILVIGLCVSRNLGGPAMALELVRGLRKRIPNVDITFAVIGIPEETVWARRLGLKITSRVSLLEYFSSRLPQPLFLLLGKLLKNQSINKDKYRRLREDTATFTRVVAAADVILNMSGIAYVGDGTLSRSHAINSYFPCYMAKKYRKPYAAFIQSYGSFEDPITRWLAKKEFEAIPFVPARGRLCAESCRAITTASKVHCFPGSAINLPQANTAWTKQYLNTHGLELKNYIVISPSSVIRNSVSKSEGSLGRKSVAAFQKIVQHLLEHNHHILLVPHMYCPNYPERCDRVVCYEILECIRPSPRNHVRVVEDEIDAMQAKALIAHARLAVVSRYHALVAALSTATPAITIGWNYKYQDILEFYGIPEMAIDASAHLPEDLLRAFINLQRTWNTHEIEICERMRQLHLQNQAKTDQAFDLLVAWLLKDTPTNP